MFYNGNSYNKMEFQTIEKSMRDETMWETLDRYRGANQSSSKTNMALTGFSNSERFLLPGVPCLIMMWAYGVSTLRKETYKLLIPWSIIVVAMEIGWAYFKLGSRGLF